MFENQNNNKKCHIFMKIRPLIGRHIRIDGRLQSAFKACSHDPFLRIRFLLVPKNGSCEHIKNDPPLNRFVIKKKKNG